ncbi:MAG TPA: hypothetical protein IAD15_08420 [Candidatus Fimiplasma intestinipullorum]|uniref:Uncharacterized protein n=1 Tax=Candidatus Fimiplasma intestinipullorum TaxID=2840825 RepID=A0A9D1HQH6_9FIRM|nr:hypothetical protein [Candidatus Fimiplasma intestinipullorum]
MPIRVKLDDTDSKEEDELAFSILAGYREGIEKQKKEEEKQENNKDLDK